MRANCISLYSTLQRIESLNIIGSFNKQDKFRMAMVEFSCDTQVLGHLYNIENNKEYNYVNQFEYKISFDFRVEPRPSYHVFHFKTTKILMKTKQFVLLGKKRLRNGKRMSKSLRRKTLQQKKLNKEAVMICRYQLQRRMNFSQIVNHRKWSLRSISLSLDENSG